MSSSAPGAVRERLRIAVQKSGRLAEPARNLLASCGLAWRESRDHLFCHGETLPVDLLLVRDDDIPGLLADGTCDLGIVGRNVLLERAGEQPRDAAPFREWRPLGFGACRLALAVPVYSDSRVAQSLRTPNWCSEREGHKLVNACKDPNGHPHAERSRTPLRRLRTRP